MEFENLSHPVKCSNGLVCLPQFLDLIIELLPLEEALIQMPWENSLLGMWKNFRIRNC